MRALRVPAFRAALMRARAQPVRCSSGGAKPPAQGPKIDPNEFTGPVSHHHTPHEAHLFGREPGAKPEGWERITMFVWVGAAVILAIGMSSRSGESLQDWAKREAAVRERRHNEGKENQYGTHYSNGKFVQEELDQVPRLAEDDE